MCIKLQKCVKKDEETRFWLLERCALPMSRTTDKTTVYQPTGHFVFLANNIIFSDFHIQDKNLGYSC